MRYPTGPPETSINVLCLALSCHSSLLNIIAIIGAKQNPESLYTIVFDVFMIDIDRWKRNNAEWP